MAVLETPADKFEYRIQKLLRSLGFEHVDGGDLKIGRITDAAVLNSNLKQNCIPEGFEQMTYQDYPHFLNQRRRLMAHKIEKYYKSL